MEEPPLILLEKLVQQAPIVSLVAAGAVAVVHPVVQQAVSMVAQEGQAVCLEAVVVPVE